MATVSVTLTRESWRATLELLLESALRLHQEGDHNAARAVLDRLTPALAIAAASKELDDTEAAIRERIGSYVSQEVRDAAGRLVREL